MNNRFANFSIVAAALVVLLHVAIRHCPITALCGIAVPFFFFASGWFLAGRCDEAGWWLRALKKRARTLLVPFLFFNTLCWVAEGGLSRGLTIGNILTPMGLSLVTPEYNVLWFVRALILLVIVAPLIVGVLRQKFVGIIWLLVAFGLQLVLTNELWSFVFSITGVFYFSTGLFCRMHGLSNPAKNWTKWLFVFSGLLLLLVSVVKFDGRWNAIAYPILLIGLWHLIPDRPWPCFVTSSAFAVYLLHQILIRIVRTAGLAQLIDGNIFVAILVWPIVLGLSIGVTFLLSRYAHKFASIIFGGRI